MMSNKYEHSWKRIESLDIWSIPFSAPSSNWGEYIKCGDDNEASYQISEDLDLIKELVDKETPMKPLNQEVIDWGLGNAGDCKNCSREVNYQNKYCDNCGQQIDWSDVSD